MTNDLKAKSQEYIELGEKIDAKALAKAEFRRTGSWDIGYSYGINIYLYENEEKNKRVDDVFAIKSIPNLISHISELQKRLDHHETERERLEDRIKDIFISRELGIGLSGKASNGTYGHGFHDGIIEALAIMTQGE